MVSIASSITWDVTSQVAHQPITKYHHRSGNMSCPFQWNEQIKPARWAPNQWITYLTRLSQPALYTYDMCQCVWPTCNCVCIMQTRAVCRWTNAAGVVCFCHQSIPSDDWTFHQMNSIRSLGLCTGYSRAVINYSPTEAGFCVDNRVDIALISVSQESDW